MQSPISIIAKKELASFFDSLTAYIMLDLVAFLLGSLAQMFLLGKKQIYKYFLVSQNGHFSFLFLLLL